MELQTTNKILDQIPATEKRIVDGVLMLSSEGMVDMHSTGGKN
jgi:hypothetical protein